MNSITIEHPDYKARQSSWSQYRLLYKGGEEFRKNASSFLLRRNKEPLEVYGERLDRVFYENYIGSIIDWYSATLFRREPLLSFQGANVAGRAFFNAFCEDCDLKGTSFTDLLRKQFTDALVYGRSYLLIDFPRIKDQYLTRAEEEMFGVSRAYLVPCSPEKLINWAIDASGNFEWVVLRSERMVQTDSSRSEWTRQVRWTKYDRQKFETYEATGNETGETAEPRIIDQGTHGLAKLNRVPLFDMNLSDGLWLMGKAAQVQLEQFNKSNALSWALTMGLFAQPVIYSEREFRQIMGESYFIQLGPNDRFGWTEPTGNVYEIAAANLARLKDEIYRVCYLLHQAGAPSTTRFGQSGLSKQRDYAITQEVIRAYGDIVKDFMKRVLKTLNAAREDLLEIDVSGLDEFDIGDLSGDIDDAKQLLNLGIQSKTFQCQVLKRLAMKYLCDVRADIKDQVSREIEEQFAG